MKHNKNCNWEKSSCSYRETHEYCPHPEHACNCDLLNKNNMDNKATEVNPFGYFKPAEEMLPLIQETRNAYSKAHEFLLTLPASRQRAIAITELETSAMWAIKGLVLNDSKSTQPEQSGVTGA